MIKFKHGMLEILKNASPNVYENRFDEKHVKTMIAFYLYGTGGFICSLLANKKQ
jgi:hypothetical protein